jgi:hypothetical protein
VSANSDRVALRQSRAELEQLPRVTQLDHQMKAFSLWRQREAGQRGRK